MTDDEPSQIDEALGLLDIPEEHRPAYRDVLSEIVQRTKQAIEEDRDVSRPELRERLEKITELSRELGRVLKGPGVEKAIRLGCVEPGVQPQALEALERSLNDLEVTRNAASKALKNLGLTGKGSPFGRMGIEPKTLLAVYGREIFGFSFQEKGRAYPGKNNEPFSKFLSYLWTAATGEDTQDWEYTINVVNEKRLSEAHNGVTMATGDAWQLSTSLKGVLESLKK